MIAHCWTMRTRLVDWLVKATLTLMDSLLATLKSGYRWQLDLLDLRRAKSFAHLIMQNSSFLSNLINNNNINEWDRNKIQREFRQTLLMLKQIGIIRRWAKMLTAGSGRMTSRTQINPLLGLLAEASTTILKPPLNFKINLLVCRKQIQQREIKWKLTKTDLSVTLRCWAMRWRRSRLGNGVAANSASNNSSCGSA